jgi:hypothetical protein
MKTCFVIIGFGTKTDPTTKRELDLDKTFENIIRPAIESIEDPKFECFRAIEKNTTGSIDKMMYHWILNADLVVADISTLNANVMYELGVRHALKPYSTIIISEDEQMKNKLPFDINHEVIHVYQHLGKDIGYSEVVRFQKVLKDLALKITNEPAPDSPVYTFINELEPPRVKQSSAKKSVTAPPVDMMLNKSEPLSHFLKEGEKAKNNGDYGKAKVMFETALERNPNDSYTRQRLALVTYKAKQPDALSALKAAHELLKPLNPSQSTDPETLGLSGAIEKRMFEEVEEKEHLERSLAFYERGYIIKQDYYNGINTAYLYMLKADKATDKMEAMGLYGRSRDIWTQVRQRCEKLLEEDPIAQYIKDGTGYELVENDLPWIYATMAEASYGLSDTESANKYVEKIKALPDTKFALESYSEQKVKLEKMIQSFNDKYL